MERRDASRVWGAHRADVECTRGDGFDSVVDDGVDPTLLIHKGNEFEEKYAKDDSVHVTASSGNAEFKCTPSY